MARGSPRHGRPSGCDRHRQQARGVFEQIVVNAPDRRTLARRLQRKEIPQPGLAEAGQGILRSTTCRRRVFFCPPARAFQELSAKPA